MPPSGLFQAALQGTVEPQLPASLPNLAVAPSADSVQAVMPAAIEDALPQAEGPSTAQQQGIVIFALACSLVAESCCLRAPASCTAIRLLSMNVCNFAVMRHSVHNSHTMHHSLSCRNAYPVGSS